MVRQVTISNENICFAGLAALCLLAKAEGAAVFADVFVGIILLELGHHLRVSPLASFPPAPFEATRR